MFVHIFTYSASVSLFSDIFSLRGPYSTISDRSLSNPEAGDFQELRTQEKIILKIYGMSTKVAPEQLSHSKLKIHTAFSA